MSISTYSSEALPPEQVQELRDVFNMFDKDKRGTVPLKDLGMAMRAAGQTPTEQELIDYMQEVDSDGKDVVDFPEFLMLVQRRANDFVSEEQLKAAFQMFDKDNIGTITATELRILMCTMGDKLTDEEMNELLGEADTDLEGNIVYEEFAKKLMPPTKEAK
eukprot:TRINITY_DN641_c0_g1_i2.p1 TRINITY_DN641_c0_g1~~TRINITY_DN641_c0_g1_i2.p1  ORF type:complete len:174 (+),score=39.80 TRINITY_DN641_c0_g1_i2:40-522(+)